ASVGQEDDPTFINRGINGPTVELASTASSAWLRYPITPVNGITTPGPNSACWAIRARYRDDAAGPTNPHQGSSAQRVYITINYIELATGDTGDIAHFNSDDFAPASGYQTQTSSTYSYAFDFQKYAYWAEVRLSQARHGAVLHPHGDTPALAAFQIVAPN